MQDWNEIVKWINEPYQPERLKNLAAVLSSVRATEGGQGAALTEAQRETVVILGLLDPRIQSQVIHELKSAVSSSFFSTRSERFINVCSFLLRLREENFVSAPSSAENLRPYFGPLLDSIPDQAACAIHPVFRTFYIFGKLSPISNALLDLLLVLRDQNTLSFSDATKLCFGIQPYDDSTHAAKIHNLLYRLRKLIPTLRISTKEHTIYLRSSLQDIKFLKIPYFAYELSLNKEWQALAEKTWVSLRTQTQNPGVREQQILLALMVNGPQTRRELQQVTGLPKPSLLRYLNSMQDAQLVLIQGRADVPIYALPQADSKERSAQLSPEESKLVD